MTFCTECGDEIRKSSVFCMEYGAKGPVNSMSRTMDTRKLLVSLCLITGLIAVAGIGAILMGNHI